MIELRRGIDILAAVGGIRTVEEAERVFDDALDRENLAKLKRIRTPEVLLKIANAISLCRPASVFVVSDSAADVRACRELALERGEEKPLRLKDHTIHFDLPEDQGRMVDQTYYIANPDEEVSVLARKLLRDEGHAYVQTHMRGIMKGLPMLVGFYNRGPVGAKAAIPGLMISSSAYVLHSGNILYPSAYAAFDAEVKRAGVFFTNVHSQGTSRSEDIPKARIFMDRSWLTTFSMFCTYAGNTLMLKKGNHRFAVDLATYHRRGSELSEHMFITGLTGPGGRKTFFAGAAPSGCGKTTTAMVGTDFVGDDLAQMWIEKDGTLRAVNPEIGIFGIVEDVNQEGDPHLMECLRKERTEVIWSNVLVDDSGTPHWTGHKEPLPARGVNYLGEWTPDKKDKAGKPVPPSNPNARCTLSNSAIANYNRKLGTDPAGVPIAVITYSGRDSDTMPPVWVARNPDEGVAIGASIVSAATATEVGAKGVGRQPWANAPFIPGPLADYMAAQFEFWNSPKLTRKPLMCGINYFLTQGARGGEGTKLLGEKRDVVVWLSWLERLVHREVQVIDTPIGGIPRHGDLARLFKELIGKDYPRELYDKQFSFYVDNIVARLDLQREAFAKENRLPPRILEVYEEERKGLVALKGRFGAVVRPADLEAAAR
jgi:phosphoenolpyruvate carboxykinase (GTP)